VTVSSEDDCYPHVTVAAGIVWADSRDVANTFGKRHDNVVQAFDALECSAEFKDLNFKVFTIQGLSDQNRGKRSHVEMTRDGFSFLVMGFTGGRAAAFKEKYIAAFNKMEAELVQRSQSKEAVQPLDMSALRAMLADTLSTTNAASGVCALRRHEIVQRPL
jgi:Rha family phage regulatory protein